jgi:hypothetical protein
MFGVVRVYFGIKNDVRWRWDINARVILKDGSFLGL